MIKYLTILILIIGLQFYASSQYHFVNIVLSTDIKNAHPSNHALFISGNDILLGSWSLKSALMKQNSDSSRVASLMLQKGHELEFCFTDGVSYISSMDSSNICPIKYTVEGDTTLVYNFSKLVFNNTSFQPKSK